MSLRVRLALHSVAIALIGLMFSSAAQGGAAQSPVAQSIAQPFETGTVFVPANEIDNLVLAKLRERGIQPANLCSDEVFVRRVYLDVIGTLPEPRAVQTFLQDQRLDKRTALIDALLARDEFADYWSLKWCDLLRVKSEFPIDLWPNAVQSYHRWVHDAVQQNMPADAFARALLTSNGSNFRVGPVNFYRAVQGRTPADIARAVALTFLGSRLDNWPAENRKGLAAFFSRICYKSTDEWKEEIICLDPASTTPLHAVYPDGKPVSIEPGQDPRQVFANWLLDPQNTGFSRNIANRIWSWLMGRGIIEEPDDIRPDNPPSNPELLEYLQDQLVQSHYNMRALYRLILNSRTYQQSSIARGNDPDAAKLFAYYPVRRLDAEVLIDAICWITGSSEDYESPVPQPYTYIPDSQRTIALADGSISSPFLDLFGRPARDTGLEAERNNQPTDAQCLHLLNSSDILQKIDQGGRLGRIIQLAQGNQRFLIGSLYLSILSRRPTAEEEAVAQNYFQTGRNLKQGAADLTWALINSKEFLYRH